MFRWLVNSILRFIHFEIEALGEQRKGQKSECDKKYNMDIIFLGFMDHWLWRYLTIISKLKYVENRVGGTKMSALFLPRWKLRNLFFTSIYLIFWFIQNSPRLENSRGVHHFQKHIRVRKYCYHVRSVTLEYMFINMYRCTPYEMFLSSSILWSYEQQYSNAWWVWTYGRTETA